MSTLLVILTAAVVAVVAHELGLSWGAVWVLGAAVAPTDATAVGVVARLLPRRNVTQLRAESLINDGTALVVYGLAVGEEHFSVPHVTGLFLLFRFRLPGESPSTLTPVVIAPVNRPVRTGPLPSTAESSWSASHASAACARIAGRTTVTPTDPGLTRSPYR